MNVIQTVRSIETSTPLYHISFNTKLEGVWTPKQQDGFELSSKSIYQELPMAGISTSPTFKKCFIGVYHNIAKFFENKNKTPINFAVYRPVFNGNEHLILPLTLTEDRLVWDAHITQEHRILDSVYMELIGEIEVKNSDKPSPLMIHPFGDVKNPKVNAGPLNPEIKWTSFKKY